MVIHIKNMVCDRCITAVRREFEGLGFRPLNIQLGAVEIQEELNSSQVVEMKKALRDLGFEWLDDRKQKAVDQIKSKIISLVHHEENELNTNLSQYLSSQLFQDYSSLSSVFSELEGTTIEKYYILQRIERAKELLGYGEQSISEISDLLKFSNPAHFSNQFKKITGQSPSQYRQSASLERLQLDHI